jgi:hypothetical protein
MATWTPPPSIDRTGATDVGRELTEFLNGGLVQAGANWWPRGTAGTYPTGSAGIPDGDTVVFPAGARYRINDMAVMLGGWRFTPSGSGGGGTFENTWRKRTGITVDFNGASLFKTNPPYQLTSTSYPPEQQQKMWISEDVNGLVLKDGGLRGPKEQFIPYDPVPCERFVSSYYESWDGQLQFVACKYVTLDNMVSSHSMSDQVLMTPRYTGRPIALATTAGSPLATLTAGALIHAEKDRINRHGLGWFGRSRTEQDDFHALHEGCPISSAAIDSDNASTISASDWEEEPMGPAWYGVPPSTPTVWPYNPNSTPWTDWPKIHIVGPRQVRIFKGLTWATRTAEFAATRTSAIQRCKVGWPDFDASYGHRIVNCYFWDSGRGQLTVKQSYKDPLFNLNCFIDNNQVMYQGTFFIDSIGDFATASGFGNAVDRGTNFNLGVNPTNDLVRPGQNLKNKQPKTVVFPPTNTGTPAPSPRYSALPQTPIVPWVQRTVFDRAPKVLVAYDRALIVDYKLTCGTVTGTAAPPSWASGVRLELSRERTTGFPRQLVKTAAAGYRVFYGFPTVDPTDKEGEGTVFACDLPFNGEYFYEMQVIGDNGALTPGKPWSDSTAPDGNIAKKFVVGGGPPPPGGCAPPPATYPVVGGSGVDRIHDTGADVFFDTNIVGNSLVIVSRQSGQVGTPPSFFGPTTDALRRVPVTGLDPGVAYVGAIFSRVPGGDYPPFPQAAVTFTTTNDGTLPPLAVTAVFIPPPNITDDGFRIVLSLNRPASFTLSAVPLDPTGSLIELHDESGALTIHDVTITGQESGRRFALFGGFEDEDGNTLPLPGSPLPYSLGEVTTLDAGLGPEITNLTAYYITNTSAWVSWDTPVPATTQLAYGLGGLTPLDSALVLHHIVKLADFPPGLLLGAQPISRDSLGRERRGDPVTFTFLADPGPNPSPVVETFASPFTSLPVFASAFLTGTDDFVGPVAVSGRARWTGQGATGGTRKVYWPASVTAARDVEVRSRWMSESDVRVQHGHLHRLTGGGPFACLTVTRNIISDGDGPAGEDKDWINVHYWNTGAASVLSQFSAFKPPAVAHENQGSGFPPPLPWNVKSRTVGRFLDVAVWLDGQAEPDYDDHDHAFRCEIPALVPQASQPGVHGVYMGHNVPGATSEIDDLSIRTLGATVPPPPGVPILSPIGTGFDNIRPGVGFDAVFTSNVPTDSRVYVGRTHFLELGEIVVAGLRQTHRVAVNHGPGTFVFTFGGVDADGQRGVF